MVRLSTISALTFGSLLPSIVAGRCLDPATANITDGAWNFNGVNGTWNPPRFDEDNMNTQDPSWTIPDESWSYPHGEATKQGPSYLTQYTCSKLQFCNPEPAPTDTEEGKRRKLVDEFSQQDVWKMKSRNHFKDCDFTDARLIGTTNATSCVEIEKDDLTAEGELSFYASKENCEAGQKIAVRVTDWEATKDSCAEIALHIPASGRIRQCDCDYHLRPFEAAYPKLCATAYQNACKSVEMPGDCCETGTCMSKMEMFDTPEGKEFELARRQDCDDEIPGNCYNMNGVSTDMSMNGSTDCCSQTCSTCGSELAAGAVFKKCTTNFPNNMTAACGRLSRYSLIDHICDFSKCPEQTHWHSDGDAVWKYMGLSKPGGINIGDPNEGEANADSAAAAVSLVMGVLSTGLVAALL